MAKTHDPKAAARSHDGSALEAKIREFEAEAKALLPEQDDLDSLDPDAVLKQNNAVLLELREAEATDKTPELQLISAHSTVTWRALLGALGETALRKTNAPGGRTLPVEVDADKRISAGIAAAEEVRRLVTQVVEAPRRRRKQVEALRLAIFGKRKPGGGRVSWFTDITAIINAIEQLQGAPEALTRLLPRLREAAAQLDNAQAQATGRPRAKPIFSAEALEAALAVTLALDELVGWAASAATPSRNGKLVGLVQPKRRGDAPPAGDGTAPGQGDGKSTGSGDGKSAPPGESKAAAQGDSKGLGQTDEKASAVQPAAKTAAADGAISPEKPAAAATP